MYNFVLKLNLATTEGKERFMRRWAVGRLATGEQPTPVEGWKFLESLGIDAAGKKVSTSPGVEMNDVGRTWSLAWVLPSFYWKTGAP